MLIDSRKTPYDLDRFLDAWCSQNEQDWRRAAFLEKLETYVPPRPRTYADRKWLEGYVETARTLAPTIFSPYKEKWILSGASFARDRITKTRLQMQRRDLTSRGAGQIDAWLDAVGC